jgi:hypothetical protein
MLLRHKLFIAMSCTIALAAFANGGSASAATSSLPNQSDFGANVRLLVGHPNASGNQGIIAPTSVVKIYSTSPTINVTINGFGQCENDGYDYLNPGATTYQIYRTTASEAQTGGALVSSSNGANCTPANSTLTATHPGPRSSLMGHTDYYVFIFRATLAGNSLGFNGFSLSAPGALIGYSQDSSDKFAIKSQFSESAPTYSTYTLRFGTSCELTSSVTKQIRWFDADQGEPNQLQQISFDLYNATTNSYVLKDVTNVGGNNQPGSETVTFQPNHKYRWTWKNVSSYNGIQMEFPFDSIYYNEDCTPPPPPPPTISCGNGVQTARPAEPGEQFSYAASFNHTAVAAGATFDYRIYLRIESIFPTRTQIGSGSISGAAGTVTATRTGLSGSSAGSYGAVYDIEIIDGPSRSCNGDALIATKPYFRAYGGNVRAGWNFRDSSGNCSINGSARILGWNQGTSSSPNGAGAGTQLAAMALNSINGFVSAAGRTAQPTPLKGLTFANTPAGAYGGNLASSAMDCMPDYFAGMAQVTQTLGSTSDLSPLNGTYRSTSSQVTIGTGNVQLNNDKVITIYVDGDVRITSRIRYNTNYNGGIDKIPSVRIIARNIYIAPGVDRIDGVLIAQPRAGDPNTGKIFTCSNGFAPPNATQLNSTCQNPLTVYGALIADQVRLLRTNGTLRNSSNGEHHTAPASQAAERVIYSPEVWLRPFGTSSDGGYESFTAMPPIL